MLILNNAIMPWFLPTVVLFSTKTMNDVRVPRSNPSNTVLYIRITKRLKFKKLPPG
jgi:hypothetical protein